MAIARRVSPADTRSNSLNCHRSRNSGCSKRSDTLMTEWNRLKEIIKEKSYEKRKVVLSSGLESDFYFDGKQTTLHAEGAYLTGKLFYEAIKDLKEVEGVGGLTLGADPIA